MLYIVSLLTYQIVFFDNLLQAGGHLSMKMSYWYRDGMEWGMGGMGKIITLNEISFMKRSQRIS